MLNRARQRLLAAGLGEAADRILSLARPAVRLTTRRARDDKLAVGSSKIGGCPDLSPGAEWPIWRDQPLAFLAQINLSDLHSFAFCNVLPREGLLQFFYDGEQRAWGFDPNDRGSWCVRLEPSIHGLKRALGGKHYLPCQLELAEVMTPPAWECYEFSQLGLSEEQRQSYFRVLDELEDPDSEMEPPHQILGNPLPVQGDMQLECQLVSNGLYCRDPSGYQDLRVNALTPGASKWRLLFQLGSDEEAEMMWGDTGRIYFWITNECLESWRFDSSWMILQCG